MYYAKKNLYLSKFRNKIFILKIGGEVVQEKRILENILRDIKGIVDWGIKVILVHGGGKQADALAHQIGHVPVKISGRRITSEQDLEIAKMLYGGSLNLEILGIMKKLHMRGIRVSGLDGELLDVRLRDKSEIDFGFVGDIDRVNPRVLLDVLDLGYLPVVSPLAVTNEGVIVNVNADTIATEIAIALKAEKLIFFTNTNGVYDGKKKISVLTEGKAIELIEKNIVTEGMVVKVHNCLRALCTGVKRVHIINGLSKHSLLGEVLTKKGIGTMFVSGKEMDRYIKE